jgi:D-alanyl-D-alanine carboxypeptidase
MKKQALDKSLDFMKDWLRFMYESGTVPGFVLAVSYKGKVLFNEAYGYADLETKEEMTPQHIFRIASHSKTFTATALMQLQEQGKLRIDDKVIDYVPWLREHSDSGFQSITIRQVMSHGAGIIRDGLDCTYWALGRPFPDAEEFKKEMLAAELVLTSNIKMKYSNFGYTLLGLVVEAASGQDYSQYVVDNIINPLGLKSTGPEYDTTIKTRLATSYTRPDYEGKKRLPIANIDTHAMSAATGFYSTAEDLCKYFSAHVVGSGKLLNDESKKEMQRLQWEAENVPHREGYGLGFVVEFIGEHQTIGHSGGIPCYATKTVCDPEEQLVISVLTNSYDAPADYMARNVLKLIDFFQEKWGTVSEELEACEGRFMDLSMQVEVIALGERLFIGYPGWEAFGSPEELVPLSDKGDQAYMIVKADSFSSNGELVKFKIGDDGRAKSMYYAGANLVREEDYITRTKAVHKIGAEFEPK